MSKKDELELGKCYTREEIHEIVGGGGVQDFLPNKSGEILAGCFRPDLNPEAPEIIFPRRGDKIKSAVDLLRNFKSIKPFPVFLKRDSHEWEYVGDYKFRNYSIDRKEIMKYLHKRPGIPNSTDIMGVMELRKVGEVAVVIRKAA